MTYTCVLMLIKVRPILVRWPLRPNTGWLAKAGCRPQQATETWRLQLLVALRWCLSTLLSSVGLSQRSLLPTVVTCLVTQMGFTIGYMIFLGQNTAHLFDIPYTTAVLCGFYWAYIFVKWFWFSDSVLLFKNAVTWRYVNSCSRLHCSHSDPAADPRHQKIGPNLSISQHSLLRRCGPYCLVGSGLRGCYGLID